MKNSVDLTKYRLKDKHLSINEIKQLRAHVESIEKAGKIFSILGGYNIVRRSLLARGWLERLVKVPKAPKQEEASLSDEDDDGLDDDEETDPKVPEESEQVTSRFLRNSISNLIWTLRSNSVDFRLLEKHQMINHFRGSWSLTTKAGLLQHLKLLSWYSDVHEETIYPRAYRLFDDDDLKAFSDDFRLTACISLLKILSSRNEQCDSPGLPYTPQYVSLAMAHIDQYLRFKRNDDLDDSPADMSEERWSAFLEEYHNIKAGKSPRLAIPVETADRISDLLKQVAECCHQNKIDGTKNIWIVKPAARSRGRGIFITDKLGEIMRVADTTYSKQKARFVVQKYIERPLLIHSTKFDIRQWFLVTDWNPLTIWIYRKSYLRFCSQQFSLVDFDASIHLNNNAIQRHYSNDLSRSGELPEENMWTSAEFDQYLSSIGRHGHWEDHIYPTIKKFVTCAVLCGQETVDQRKNSFELYGADFIIDENLQTWLIEINSSPSMDLSTSVTHSLCPAVLDDTIKVVCDRRGNKTANIGDFELLYKGMAIPTPHYIGSSLTVEGLGIRIPKPPKLPPVQRLEPKDLAEKNCEVKKTRKLSVGKERRKRQNDKENYPRKLSPIVRETKVKIDQSELVGRKIRGKQSRTKKVASKNNQLQIDRLRDKRAKEEIKSHKKSAPGVPHGILRSSSHYCHLRDLVDEHNMKLLARIKFQARQKSLIACKVCLPYSYNDMASHMGRNLRVYPAWSRQNMRQCLRISNYKPREEKREDCRIEGLDSDFCLNSNYWRARIN